MLVAPVPDLFLDNIYGLLPETLVERGIGLLFLDLDNTLVPYGREEPGERLRGWIASLRAAGIELFILSNNRGARPEAFGRQLSLDYEGRARKPSVKALAGIMEKKGVPPQRAAIVGDQIFTDVLCGKRAGIFTVAVRPIKFTNPLLLLRYGVEYPFRAAARRRGK